MSARERIRDVLGWIAAALIIVVCVLWFWPDLPGTGWLRDRFQDDPAPVTAPEQPPGTTTAPSTTTTAAMRAWKPGEPPELGSEYTASCTLAFAERMYVLGYSDGASAYQTALHERPETTVGDDAVEVALNLGMTSFDDQLARDGYADAEPFAGRAASVAVGDAVWHMSEAHWDWRAADLEAQLQATSPLFDDTNIHLIRLFAF